MNTKNPNTDSGNYIDGIYTTKNGYNLYGLNCPKGTRLYDVNIIPAIFFPETLEPGEEYISINPQYAPNILPYYAVSNYGHIANVYTGKIMKENYRPNGYGYFCLAANNSKNGQKKYLTHRMVIGTFNSNNENLSVNHKDGNKKNNKLSNLEWSTIQENTKHRSQVLHPDVFIDKKFKLNKLEAKKIRQLHDSGFTYKSIQEKFYPEVSVVTIQNICRNVLYKDENYYSNNNHFYYNNTEAGNGNGYFKITNEDANRIRQLHKDGYNIKQIQEKFYPRVSRSTISDIVRNITHKN